MGVTVNSGTVTVSGSVSVAGTSTFPTLSTSQEVFNAAGTGDTTVQSVYTVPAGKRLDIFSLSSAQNQGLTLYKNDGSTRLVYIYDPNASPRMSCFTPIWSYAAGEVLKAQGTPGGSTYNIWGILVTL